MPETEPPAAPQPELAPRKAAIILALLALAPVLLALLVSYLAYRSWPFMVPMLGMLSMGWLQHRMLRAWPPGAEPVALTHGLAAGIWLVYAMYTVYGWRLEMGYWASLWLVFGGPFVMALFWAAVLTGVMHGLHRHLR